MSMRLLPLCLLAGVLSLCVACSGGGLNTVQGKVTYNGKPIKGAVLVFVPKDTAKAASAQRPSGVTIEDGTFKLTTGTKQGAPAGEYDVAITWPEETKATGKISMKPDDEDPRDRLNGRYADASKSSLTATIKSGTNTLPTFELK